MAEAESIEMKIDELKARLDEVNRVQQELELNLSKLPFSLKPEDVNKVLSSLSEDERAQFLKIQAASEANAPKANASSAKVKAHRMNRSLRV